MYNPDMSESSVEEVCADCWNEALSSLGIPPETVHVSQDKSDAVRDTYDDWHFSMHEVGKNTISPRRFIKVG